MLPRDAVVRRSHTTPDARRIAWRVAARWTGTSGSTSSPAPPSPALPSGDSAGDSVCSQFEEEQLVERQSELGDDGIERVHGRSCTARLDLGDEARRDLEALGQPADAQAAGEASRSEAVAHRGIAGPRFLHRVDVPAPVLRRLLDVIVRDRVRPSARSDTGASACTIVERSARGMKQPCIRGRGRCGRVEGWACPHSLHRRVRCRRSEAFDPQPLASAGDARERPIISRLERLEHPVELKEGMVIALESWCPRDGTGCRRPASRHPTGRSPRIRSDEPFVADPD